MIKRMNFEVIQLEDVRVPFKMIVSKFQIFLPTLLQNGLIVSVGGVALI